MYRYRALLVFLVVGATAGIGCIDEFPPPSTTPPIGRPLTAPRSFAVDGPLQLFAANGAAPQNVPSMGQEVFILRVDPSGATMIMGAFDAAIQVPLISKDGVAFHAATPVTFPVRGGTCGSSATYTDFRFMVGVDSISGTASGTAVIGQGDVIFQYAAQLTFSGVPDSSGPRISGTGANLDPLAQLSFISSEPLPSTATARLVLPDGEQVALGALAPAELSTALVGFRKSTDALRYGATYKMVIDPWTDLAGNPGTIPDDVTTLPMPPLVPEDGFESALDTLGGAMILGSATMPAISGEKSAVIGLSPTPLPLAPGTRLTVRLAVNPGDRFVRLSLRPFTRSTGAPPDPYNTNMRVAVPGGSTVNVNLPSFSSSSTQTVIVNGTPIVLGDVIPIEAALPADVGDEIVFDLVTVTFADFCSPPLSNPGYQIDDLRVE